jgi:hypothetical protein
MNENEVKKCPKCGQEMEKGNIRLSSGVRWRTDDLRVWQEGELLWWGSFWGYVKRDAYRCKNCRLLTLPY